MPRLLVAISAHGLGHLGQVAPVCNALHALRPDIALSIWSALPVETLGQRIHVPFTHIANPCDIGFIMLDALHVDVPASWQRYLHREYHWAAYLEEAIAIVRAAQPDLIVSDVGEMPLAAGQALGIPNIAMSSLNWADMAKAYFANLTGSAAVLSRLAGIYDNTTCALRLSPGMPMRGHQEQILPPVGAVSNLRRHEIEQGLRDDLPHPYQPRILIGMGGIETALPLDQWPLQNKLNLLVANQPTLVAQGDPARGIVNADTLCMRHAWNFCDLLTGCDVVICKPGYGTFVEAALAGRPVLYVKRPEWPEQTALIGWLHEHARCTELAMTDLRQGKFDEKVSELMAQSPLARLPHNGATIAAQTILDLTHDSGLQVE